MKHFDSNKMFTYLKGFSQGSNLEEVTKALNYVRRAHKSQLRKNGEPYIIHPLTMTCHAVALGVRDDTVLASLLYHDVVEDCGVSINDLPCNNEVKNVVELLTYKKPVRDSGMSETQYIISMNEYKKKYYSDILNNRAATLCKIIDRCHNVSTMSGVFTSEKVNKYIDETVNYIFPLLKEGKELYPEDANYYFVLKYHITSVLEAIHGITMAYNGNI